MKIQTFLIVTVLLAGGAAAHADEASRIARVTLYPGSAAVERVAHVAAGATRLEIGGLPANFDVQTIRVEADNGIRIGELSVQDVSGTEAAGGREAEIVAKIRALDDQIGMLDVERKSSELVTGYLQGLGTQEAGPKAAPLDAKGLAAVLEAIHRGGNDSFARIQRVDVQKREIERQKQALQQELERVRSGAQDTRRRLSIGLAADRAGDVHVSYLVNGPGWRPTYRAALDSTGAKVELERQAVIAQSSGEDWSKVSLRLSTGQPRQSPQGSEVRPWRLSILMPSRPMPLAMAAAPAPAKAMLAERANRVEEPLFDVREVQSAFATEFEVPGQVSLPADGRKLTVSLGRQTLPVKLSVQVVPRQDTTAYLVAETSQPEGVWLAGNIQLLRDGSHVGATYWNPQTGEHLQLPFGRDDLVRVSVAHVRENSAESGLITQRSERQIADTYTVENRHRQAINLLLLEPSPQSTNEQIKVEAKFQPKPSRENWDDKPGVVAWEQSIAAGAKQNFSVDYRIVWPKDSAINGLP
ncbi:mucoidy inhibitor MuiA family protein [Uliginosibacterium gangwonense]|uniref:mucoidy inhibitor MuiA family protein n=1 Tax=Uliginosibacterium gangwonense TaxID=392736 RepID=UPI00037C7E7B|nr:mucoidy inhibitor MuiA family protein [Uliginosibacterium gangwonense]